MKITKFELFQKHEEQLDRHRLESAYANAGPFPIRRELQRIPALADDDSDAPRGAGVDENSKVLQFAPRTQWTKEASVC
jgi:hypothetical protein